MTIVHSLVIDMLTPDTPSVVNVAQLDSNTRVIKASLWQGSVAFIPDVNVAISLACIKPDRSKCWYDQLSDGSAAVSVEGNIVSVTLAPEALSVAGTVKAALVIRTDLTKQISTFPFIIRVLPNPAAESVISNSYYKISSVAQLNEEWEKLEQKMSTAICFTEQTLDETQRAQARANIGALATGIQKEFTINSTGDTKADVTFETEIRESGITALNFYSGGYEVGAEYPTLLSCIAPGVQDYDAATVGQVKEMVKQAGGGSLSAEVIDNVLVVTLSGGLTASVENGVLVVA